MADAFASHNEGLESPATRLVDITPSDVSDLPFATRAINVGTAGWVTVRTVAGVTGRFYVAAGIPFPVRADRILQTGTTATDIVALA